MTSTLVVEVHLHSSRFHGRGEWPPSPARLFQAMVAGTAQPHIGPEARAALEWLETLGAPVIACPPHLEGQKFDSFVPNNDLDAVGGDLARIGEIRTMKRMEPKVLTDGQPFLYCWALSGPLEISQHLETLQKMAETLYQFGRGVDMAWASARVIDESEIVELLRPYAQRVHTPSPGPGGTSLRGLGRGSLHSLELRHAAQQQRIQTHGSGRKRTESFSQPPKPFFVAVSYDRRPDLPCYELRLPNDLSRFSPWPQRLAVSLIEIIRNAVVERLIQALPSRVGDIQHVLVGRRADGSNGYPTALRVQIIPLPSVGHEFASGGIRRVCVRIPPGTALAPDDIDWAFCNLEIGRPDKSVQAILVRSAATDSGVPAMYGLTGREGSVWRTVTPVALPPAAARRRIEPSRRREQAKNGVERQAEEAIAVQAVRQALRHAGIPSDCSIQLQREPFQARGTRVEGFSDGTRFAKERLWHVRLTFPRPQSGPLVIGDGRFLGLGVMSMETHRVIALAIRDGLHYSDAAKLAYALRRALMARVQGVIGLRRLPTVFSGHSADDGPAVGHVHLQYTYDPRRALLLVVPPFLRSADAKVLEQALDSFEDLKAGDCGRLLLERVYLDEARDDLLRPSRVWQSLTPYEVTRHARKPTIREVMIEDVFQECDRRKMKRPICVEVQRCESVAGHSMRGMLRLTFDDVVAGPLLLGRSRHIGGGLFSGGRA